MRRLLYAWLERSPKPIKGPYRVSGYVVNGDRRKLVLVFALASCSLLLHLASDCSQSKVARHSSRADVPVSTLGITAYTVARIAQASPPLVFTTLSPTTAPEGKVISLVVDTGCCDSLGVWAGSPRGGCTAGFAGKVFAWTVGPREILAVRQGVAS